MGPFSLILGCSHGRHGQFLILVRNGTNGENYREGIFYILGDLRGKYGDLDKTLHHYPPPKTKHIDAMNPIGRCFWISNHCNHLFSWL
jgi:hypothetical protein